MVCGIFVVVEEVRCRSEIRGQAEAARLGKAGMHAWSCSASLPVLHKKPHLAEGYRIIPNFRATDPSFQSLKYATTANFLLA